MPATGRSGRLAAIRTGGRRSYKQLPGYVITQDSVSRPVGA